MVFLDVRIIDETNCHLWDKNLAGITRFRKLMHYCHELRVSSKKDWWDKLLYRILFSASYSKTNAFYKKNQILDQ